MSDTVLVAIIGVIGTVLVALFNSFIGQSKTLYRLEQLEKKVDKHNNVVERMTLAERDIATIANEVKELKDHSEKD